LFFITHNYVFITYNSKLIGPTTVWFVWIYFQFLFPSLSSLIFEWWVMKTENTFLGVFKLWKLGFHSILVNKHTLLGLASLIKSDFPYLSHRSLSTFFFSFFLFFLCSSSEQNLTHIERQKILSLPHPRPLFSDLPTVLCPSPFPRRPILRTTSQRRSTSGCVNSGDDTARLEWWLWVQFF